MTRGVGLLVAATALVVAVPLGLFGFRLVLRSIVEYSDGPGPLIFGLLALIGSVALAGVALVIWRFGTSKPWLLSALGIAGILAIVLIGGLAGLVPIF